MDHANKWHRCDDDVSGPCVHLEAVKRHSLAIRCAKTRRWLQQPNLANLSAPTPDSQSAIACVVDNYCKTNHRSHNATCRVSFCTMSLSSPVSLVDFYYPDIKGRQRPHHGLSRQLPAAQEIKINCEAKTIKYCQYRGQLADSSQEIRGKRD